MATPPTSEPDSEQSRPILRSLRAAQQRDRSPIRVVIIDDHLVAEMQRAVLEQAGSIEVVGLASDGLAGLALIEHGLPDVVILELCLRGMDGPEVVQRVRVSFPQVAVLLVTAYD
ncbi:MAG TPA: response regulator transcription factor [Acidobacteriaceae bacterium]|nr:response regulator transcription factor [Chloroflexota bacterium]HLI76439.1 response regulator transcription factor [Acidobacteriaceae bacterium]